MARPAVLDHAQAPRRDLLVDPVVEEDHAVGYVFLEALAGERVGAALAGDDGGDTSVFQPAEETSQFGTQHTSITEPGEERFDGVEDDAAGASGAQGVVEAD